MILDGNSDVCVDKNVKYTKHTRHIYRRELFLRNGENVNSTRLDSVKEV